MTLFNSFFSIFFGEIFPPIFVLIINTLHKCIFSINRPQEPNEIIAEIPPTVVAAVEQFRIGDVNYIRERNPFVESILRDEFWVILFYKEFKLFVDIRNLYRFPKYP